MSSKILELFTDKEIVEKIQQKLPTLFQIAELESSRAGKIGMEVGSVREKILVALLIYKFGEKNVQTDIPITESEVDVEVFENPISIKTISGKNSGIKLIWTVDAEKSFEFAKNYSLNCDLLLSQIIWNGEGGLYFISKKTQIKILAKIGRENYIKLPKKGTNPRGVEMSAKGSRTLLDDSETLKIKIFWKKEKINFNNFERWLDLWKQ